MSKDYHNICQKIHQSNDEIYHKENFIREINSIKKDLKNLSRKLDKIYEILYSIKHGGEFGL